MRARLVAGLLAVTALAVAPIAHAGPTKDECIDANAKGQDLRREGKLTEARARFRVCATEACPRILRVDCVKRLDEAETAQPTLAFEVKDPSGADVPGVTCTIDGVAVASQSSGAALAIDPGKHEVTIAAPGFSPVTRALVVTEGEKGRRERVVLMAPVAVALPVPPVAPPLLTGSGPRRPIGFVGSGVGVVGLATGSIFGAFALSKKSQQQTDCGSGTSCENHAAALRDHSDGTTDALVSTVSFIAGGALLAGGLALIFTAGHGRAPSDDGRRALSFTPTLGPGGGGALLRGEF